MILKQLALSNLLFLKGDLMELDNIIETQGSIYWRNDWFISKEVNSGCVTNPQENRHLRKINLKSKVVFCFLFFVFFVGKVEGNLFTWWAPKKLFRFILPIVSNCRAHFLGFSATRSFDSFESLPFATGSSCGVVDAIGARRAESPRR